MLLVMAGAVVAYVRAGWSFGDAVYMVIVTVYTVGYGEVHPVETPLGHTPHIVLSFAAERKDFGSHWSSLVENATLFGKDDEEEDGPHREAAAWLTVPTVAAA